MNLEVGYYPIQLAAVKGNIEIIQLVLKNNSVDINCCDEKTGVNSFWLAAFFGHGQVMTLLAEAGIDISC